MLYNTFIKQIGYSNQHGKGGKMKTYMYEAIEHDINFPAKIFTTSIGKSYYHWHYDYELLVVLKGSIILTIWPESRVVYARDIILINSKVVHAFNHTNEDNICLFIQLRKELFENWQDKKQNFHFYLNSAFDVVKPKIPYSEFIRTAALIALTSPGESLVDTHRIKALLYGLIADLFEYTQYDIRQYHPDYEGMEEETDILLRIIEFVEQNFTSENISNKVCRYIGMSEKTLYRFLKRHIDLTLKDLVIITKLEKAQYLLSETEKQICIVAQECGFGNDKTFYRIFKNKFGVTPTEYRQYGTAMETNKKIKGYLDFNKGEAKRILLNFV